MAPHPIESYASMRRTSVIIVLFLLGGVLLWFYFQTRLPPGIEPKGAADDLKPWIALAGSVVTLLAGLASLVLKVIEIRLKLLTHGRHS